MFLFLNASPELIVTGKMYAHTFHISNNSKTLATDENCEKQQFLSNLGPLPQKVYFTQFDIFSSVGGSRRSHINLKSEIVNVK